MKETLIRIPVRCPLCGKDWTSVLTKRELEAALARGSEIRVYADCHYQAWNLSAGERDELAAKLRLT